MLYEKKKEKSLTANKIHHILILGAGGQLGTNLVKSKWPQEYSLKGLSHEQLDITDIDSLEKEIQSQRWSFVINATGYVKVDKAEQAGQEPYLVNGLGILWLATICKKHNIPVFHYSTDYVFDGSKNTPYVESDTFNPLNTYGLSKLFGELALKSVLDKHIILRSSWVYGVYGRNFVKTVLQKARAEEDIFVVNDQKGTPTCAEDIVEVTKEIIFSQLGQCSEEKWGTYHYAGLGETTWYEYANYILNIAYQDLKKPVSKNIPITAETQRRNCPNFTFRPKYSALCSSLIKNTFSVKERSWKDGVKKVVEQLSTL